jgi:EAL domain-containing protein (putative c-di-GMP-specific phosphodiesterase class I)/CheY-like chemotaxis protein
VLLITGLGDIADRVAGLQAGADDYIVKPVHLDELVARVRATLRGQAAWASVLEVELRERAEVAATLARLRLEATPEMTAASICGELARLRELPFVALLGFDGDDGASTLAVHGALDGPLRAGSPLPGPLAAALRRHAATGPWSDARAFEAEAGGSDMAEEFRAIGVTATVNAPLRAQGVLLGLLVVGIRPSQPATDDELARTLPAVIDFAAIASALLGPALAARSAHGDATTRLEAVIANRAFTPVFQPIFELESGRVVGYEALTRFDDGTPPEVRFAEAARLGLGVALESACLSAAVSAARALEPSSWLSLNVSPALVLEGVILREVVDGADRPLLVELTEHDPVDDYPRLRAALDRLGEGARLSVDDAGSGYASLKHILALRPAFVKLDSTWVSGLQNDPARQALVAGLMYFASTTGCQLIAEGVETTEERAALDRLAVKLGQGYLLGHPRPLA